MAYFVFATVLLNVNTKGIRFVWVLLGLDVSSKPRINFILFTKKFDEPLSLTMKAKSSDQNYVDNLMSQFICF